MRVRVRRRVSTARQALQLRLRLRRPLQLCLCLGPMSVGIAVVVIVIGSTGPSRSRLRFAPHPRNRHLLRLPSHRRERRVAERPRRKQRRRRCALATWRRERGERQAARGCRTLRHAGTHARVACVLALVSPARTHLAVHERVLRGACHDGRRRLYLDVWVRTHIARCSA